jgi:hypothetical protein
MRRHLRANHLAADRFEYLHDIRVVRTPEISQRGAMEGSLRELGDRLVRVLFPGAREPYWIVRILDRAAETIQEFITLTVFSVFSVFYLGERMKWNYAAGFACMVLGVFFVFHKW